MVISDNSGSRKQKIQFSIRKKDSGKPQAEDKKISVVSKGAKSIQASEQVFWGTKFEAENNLERAIECYLRAINLSPEDAKVRRRLVKVLKKLGRYKEAKLHQDLLDKLQSGLVNSSLEPGTSDVSNLESRNIHSLEQAKLVSSSELATLPSSAQGGIVLPDSSKLHFKGYVAEPEVRVGKVYLEQAQSLYDERNWHSSIETCKKALDVCPSLALAHKIWGNCLHKQGNASAAIGQYAKALEIDPNLAEVYANMGGLLALKKRWEESIEYFQQSLSINPRLASTHRNLAKIWEELGEEEKAEEHFFRAIELEPDKLTVQQYLTLAKEFVLEGRQDKAILCYRFGSIADPNCEETYLKLIEIYEFNEQWREANQCYRKLLDIKDRSLSGETISERANRFRRLLAPSKFSTKSSLYALPPSRKDSRSNKKQAIAVSKVKKKSSYSTSRWMEKY